MARPRQLTWAGSGAWKGKPGPEWPENLASPSASFTVLDKVATVTTTDEAILQTPLCTWNVPLHDGADTFQVTAFPGQVTTIVGVNGAGKSALGFWLNQQFPTLARRLIAHRKLWFTHAGPDVSPAQREQTGQHMRMWSQSPDSRHLDHAEGQRTSIVLFDLLAMINSQNERMVGLFQQGATPESVASTEGRPLLDRVNAILDASGIPVKLRLTDRQTFDAVNDSRGTQYPINQMSDGEKSALLLAAELLTAPSGTVQIIDEPERHLHRSISAGLVEAVIDERPDCHFLVLTHDLELASTLALQPGQTLTLAGCSWVDSVVQGWDLGLVDPQCELPESARRAILGGRRNVLFIEGEGHSLDIRLYQVLFPSWTHFPAGGCEQVVRAVSGLRSSEDHHWIAACGVVDGDGRDEQERRSLLDRGILCLPVSEVENIYYLDPVIASVAVAQGELRGVPAQALRNAARDAAMSALGETDTLDRLAADLAMSELRRRFVDQIPKKIDASVDPIEISVPSPFPAIRARLGRFWQAGDYGQLIALVPIRDTAVRSRVARSLGFQNADDYESAVRVRIQKDHALASHLRALVGPMPV